MASFWESVRDRLEVDGRVFIVLVVGHSVHSPGTTGARMAVFADGSSVGTVGGGVMELNIVSKAVKGFGDPIVPPWLRKLHHRKEGDGEKSGLICAGHQTNLYAWLERGRDLEVVNAVVAAEGSDEPEILEISPQFMRVVRRNAAEAKIQYDLQLSGESWRYREFLRNLSRVAILGGGHCGLALSRVMHRLGYHVTIFDTRPRVSTMLENDFADEKQIIGDFLDAGEMIQLPRWTSVVVMTTELDSDIRALLGLAQASSSFPFVGVMGSRAKIVAIRKAMGEAEVPDEFLRRLVAPVGLPIGSNTPDEIAVSVSAQLLQLRSEPDRIG